MNTTSSTLQPPKDKYNKAIKLLEQYERLMNKYRKEISPKTFEKLQTLGEILPVRTSQELYKPSFQENFAVNL